MGRYIATAAPGTIGSKQALLFPSMPIPIVRQCPDWKRRRANGRDRLTALV